MKLLDTLRAIPVWNDLVKLPAKVAELEKRLEALERPDNSFDMCPKCKKATYELISSVPHPLFGDVGSKLRTYKCKKCDFSEEIQYDPS